MFAMISARISASVASDSQGSPIGLRFRTSSFSAPWLTMIWLSSRLRVSAGYILKAFTGAVPPGSSVR